MFCVYLTIYKGNKLPCFYIGSTSITKINKGYRGSVSSKEYKKLWKHEQVNNPNLFKTVIISLHNTRLEAMNKENILQTMLKVTENPLYLNKSYAVSNGVFGRDNTGISNPMYGKRRLDSKLRMLKNNPMQNLNTVSKMLKSKQILRDNGKHKSTRNRQSTLESTRLRMSSINPSSIKCSCIKCHKLTNLSAIIRYHKNCNLSEKD